MNPIDDFQARDHLEMVERILTQTQQRLFAGGEFFVAWGLASAAVTILANLVARGELPSTTLWLAAALLAACILFSIVRSQQLNRVAPRRSLVQREFFHVLWLTMGLAFVVNVAAYRIFAGIASTAIWSFACAIVLFYIGMHGNRRAQVGGAIVLASMIVASFSPPQNAAYVLAAGMILGYAGFGFAELAVSARD